MSVDADWSDASRAVIGTREIPGSSPGNALLNDSDEPSIPEAFFLDSLIRPDSGGAAEMELDPALVAVAGALVTVTGLFYRFLLMRIDELTKERDRYRERYYVAIGMAAIATDEAE